MGSPFIVAFEGPLLDGSNRCALESLASTRILDERFANAAIRLDDKTDLNPTLDTGGCFASWVVRSDPVDGSRVRAGLERGPCRVICQNPRWSAGEPQCAPDNRHGCNEENSLGEHTTESTTVFELRGQVLGVG